MSQDYLEPQLSEPMVHLGEMDDPGHLDLQGLLDLRDQDSHLLTLALIQRVLGS